MGSEGLLLQPSFQAVFNEFGHKPTAGTVVFFREPGQLFLQFRRNFDCEMLAFFHSFLFRAYGFLIMDA